MLRRFDLPYRNPRSIIHKMPASETIQRLETEAAKLHLSLSAYILYLHNRVVSSSEPGRLDRQVREVFGKHGELMRRLAK